MAREGFRSRAAWRGWRVPTALAIAAVGLAEDVRAVDDPPPAERVGEAPAPAPFPDPFDRQTPRSSVHGYLAAGVDGNWDRAANFLDLTSIPGPKRGQQGPRLARQLKIVLDQKLWVQLDGLSPLPGGLREDDLRAGRDRVGSIETGSGRVDILVERVPREDGKRIWKISASTVARIPKLYDEFGWGRLGELLPPIFFAHFGLQVQLWQWVAVLLLVFFAYAGSWFATRGVVAVIRPAVSRSQTEIDDRVFEAIVSPLRLISALVIFSLGILTLGLSPPALKTFTNLEKAVAVIGATWLILRLISVFADVVEARLDVSEKRAARSLVPIGRRTVQMVVIALAALAALDSFGFDVTALIAGLGVGGLALALAAQKTLENLFGGVTLIADRPVQVGDFCRFGDKLGTVEDIGMRSTRLRTLDRTIVTVPNAEFSTLQLENFGARDRIWYHPTIGLLYDTTPDQLRWVLVEIRKMLYAHPRVDPDPARVRFTNFGGSSLDLDIFAYVRATDYSEYLEIAEDLNLRIMDVVAASGTGFAFPSTTAYLAKDSGVDEEKARAAEDAVRGWREQGELYLPAFPREKIRELQSEPLDFPNRGSPLHQSRDREPHGDE